MAILRHEDLWTCDPPLAVPQPTDSCLIFVYYIKGQRFDLAEDRGKQQVSVLTSIGKAGYINVLEVRMTGQGAGISLLACICRYVQCNTGPALRSVAQEFPNWPLFITGHSMGGKPILCCSTQIFDASLSSSSRTLSSIYLQAHPSDLVRGHIPGVRLSKV